MMPSDLSYTKQSRAKSSSGSLVTRKISSPTLYEAIEAVCILSTHPNDLAGLYDLQGKLHLVTQLYDSNSYAVEDSDLLALNLNFTRAKINIQQWNSISSVSL